MRARCTPGCPRHSEAGRGEGLPRGQMLAGRVPGGPFRGRHPHSLKESNRFQEGKECSSFDDGETRVCVGVLGGTEAGQPQSAAPLDVTPGLGGQRDGGRFGQAGTSYLGKTLAGDHQGVWDFRPLVSQKSCHKAANLVRLPWGQVAPTAPARGTLVGGGKPVSLPK